MDRKEKHTLLVKKIQKKFEDLRKQKGHPLSLHKHNHSSNVTRSPSYKKSGYQLNINDLNQVLSIDVEKGVVVVEPRVTMEQLARATLKYGVMVPVTPEFKGITVGGAIMGAGIESSSHRYGIFSDNCLAYEILLGDGSIIRATPEENSDLFYAATGSYGSLGIILSAELKLIPAKPWVKLTTTRFHSVEESVSHLQNTSHTEEGPDFLEGLVYSHDHQTVIEGSFLSEEESSHIQKTLSLKHSWSDWFYRHIKDVSSNQEVTIEKIPLFDYIFRHDRGAFWMGAYGCYWNLFVRYFLESRLRLPALGRLFPRFNPETQRGPKDPSLLYRALLGWTMTSQRLYTWLHSHSEEWVATRCIIQDFCLPVTQTAPFISKVLDEIGITPLWLCPTPATSTPQIFSPHYLPNLHNPLVINVGIYGIGTKALPAPELTQELESWVHDAGGRKALYSHSYYTPEEFWSIYPQKAYQNLRHAYHAETLTDIDKKALMKQ